MKTYTQEEVSKALCELNDRLEDKILLRKDIGQEIRAIRENIKYYQELDLRQLRIDV